MEHAGQSVLAHGVVTQRRFYFLYDIIKRRPLAASVNRVERLLFFFFFFFKKKKEK